jgi:hypothetical protein
MVTHAKLCSVDKLKLMRENVLTVRFLSALLMKLYQKATA